MCFNILLAEDDKDIVELLSLYLNKEGYKTIVAYNGSDALDLFKTNEVHLCIFDIMMPELNGFDLVEQIRETSSVPIIFLSAKDQDEDKILGLNVGADDYITKPFNPLELVARIKAVLRRNYSFKVEDTLIKIGDLTLNTDKFTLYKNNKKLNLTPTEYKIMMMLMKEPGKIFTRSQIFNVINGQYLESDDNTMMVHISRLRDKVEDDPKNPKYIKTIRGLGYKIDEI